MGASDWFPPVVDKSKHEEGVEPLFNCGPVVCVFPAIMEAFSVKVTQEPEIAPPAPFVPNA